jgi:hypothetical protein
MKEPARTINKSLSYGSFKTIPNSLRQLPFKNLIISEALLKSICFKKLNRYELLNISLESLNPFTSHLKDADYVQGQGASRCKTEHTWEYVSILKRLATHLNEYNITGSPVMRGNTVIGH